ncbi:uncharacterized protein LOC143022050 [Oratosquilla oratoria]|uniref:uncharacterized protein LOC143022050 n=1 Tax=Oratosquilla oratoria TaxID=337810 RepID=UPI003F75F0BF
MEILQDFFKSQDLRVLLSADVSHLLEIGNILELDLSGYTDRADILRVVVSHLIERDLLPPEAILYTRPPRLEDSGLRLKLREMELLSEERKLRMELELKAKEEETKIRLAEIKLSRVGLSSGVSSFSPRDFDVTRYIKLVPQFSEKEPETFFVQFEKIATQLKIPREYWTMMQSSFIGKAQQIYSSLPLSENSYESVKIRVLKAYELVPEAYRLKFRNFKKLPQVTFVEFAAMQERLLDKWCAASEVDSLEKFRELILVEQFNSQLDADLRVYLEVQKPNSLSKAAILAEEYALTHSKKYKTADTDNFKRTTYNTNTRSTPTQNSKPEVTHTNSYKSYPNYRDLHCTWCNKHGHTVSTCFKKQGKSMHAIQRTTLTHNTNCVSDSQFQEKPASPPKAMPLELTSKPPVLSSNASSTCGIKMEVDPCFLPFISTGTISTTEHDAPIQVSILRDTAAKQSLILAQALTNLQLTYILICPLHKIYLTSDLVTGPVEVAVIDSLPVPGIQLLLANDLAGSKVTLPIVTESPNLVLDSPLDNLDLYPACAVTRSQSRKVDEEDSFDLTCLFSSEPETLTITDPLPLTRENLLKEQKSDETLVPLFEKAATEAEVNDTDRGLYIRKGVLMRKYRPAATPADQTWEEVHQIVVPTSYREKILDLAHSSALSGHLGVRKTLKRVSAHFHWPTVVKDVSDCRACPTCQLNSLIELGVMHTTSSPYHPQSQGALERFHGTLKSMMRDQVLVYLPVAGEPLMAKYQGPYTILEKASSLNYIIHTPEKRKTKRLVHINTLKPFYHRIPIASHTTVGVDETERFFPQPELPLQNSKILEDLDSKVNHLEPYQRCSLKKLLLKFPSLFTDSPRQTELVQHEIKLVSQDPIKLPPYRLNPTKRECLRKEVNSLIDQGIIEPSHSPWSSPCILIPKSNNTYRLVVDYRRVNEKTKADAYPLPRIEDIIDNLGTATFLTKLDFLHGFYQISLHPDAKEITAFVTPDGLYHFNVMPFGLRNSPATYQRLINTLIIGLPGVRSYLDDIIIYSKTWEEHLTQLYNFLSRADQARLTLNLAKSEFGQAQVAYLGHAVGNSMVKPLDLKVKAITNLPRPTNRREVRRVLGMFGYYRRYCKIFAEIAEPLTNLLRKDQRFQWTPTCDQAFAQLKSLLKHCPVLITPDYTLPFHLYTDSSEVGIGAALLQERHGTKRVVAYFSRKLKPSQRHYSTIEKECLALIEAFRHFEPIIGGHFEIHLHTDHNPLVYLNRMANTNQKLTRCPKEPLEPSRAARVPKIRASPLDPLESLKDPLESSRSARVYNMRTISA